MHFKAHEHDDDYDWMMPSILHPPDRTLFQNTYTNAEKLLAAAEELAQTGECNADDIYRWYSRKI